MNSEIPYLKTTKFEIVDLGIMEEDVYDIEIKNSHNFFANDILVHNSSMLNLEYLVNKMFKDQTDKQKIVDFDFSRAVENDPKTLEVIRRFVKGD